MSAQIVKQSLRHNELCVYSHIHTVLIHQTRDATGLYLWGDMNDLLFHTPHRFMLALQDALYKYVYEHT